MSAVTKRLLRGKSELKLELPLLAFQSWCARCFWYAVSPQMPWVPGEGQFWLACQTGSGLLRCSGSLLRPKKASGSQPEASKSHFLFACQTEEWQPSWRSHLDTWGWASPGHPLCIPLVSMRPQKEASRGYKSISSLNVLPTMPFSRRCSNASLGEKGVGE